jgi:hypothetical protein
MSGPTQSWDHSDDPRERTAALPRVDPADPDHASSDHASSIYASTDLAGTGLAGTDGVSSAEADTARRPTVPMSAARPPDPRAPAPRAPDPQALSPVAVQGAQPAAPAQSANGPGRRREVHVPGSGSGSARPPTWSLADLRARLAKLPDGHPSSPYDDGGSAKPSPPRLRQLELGLPAPERERVTGTTSSREAEPSVTPPIDVLAEFRNGHEPPNDSDRPAADEPAGPVEPADEPAVRVDPADEPTAASGLADVPAALTEPPEQPAVRVDPADDQDEPVSHSRSAVANGLGHRSGDFLTRRYSAPPAAPGRNGDRHRPARRELQDPYALPPITEPAVAPPESAPLSAEHRALVKRVLAAAQAAEGQNMFGSYGERGITPAIRRIASQLPGGGLAADSEAGSLKEADRFSAKLARLIARFPGTPPEQLAASMSDAIRYAFTFEPADYTEGTRLVQRKLKAQGFELQARRNRWASPEYKGIWTRWRDPAHDLPFEVQFHTTASWAVIRRTHDAYVQITDPATAPDERARLRARQVAAAAAATAPPGCLEIADFRQESR